jgi:hypothetical protein
VISIQPILNSSEKYQQQAEDAERKKTTCGILQKRVFCLLFAMKPALP